MNSTKIFVNDLIVQLTPITYTSGGFAYKCSILNGPNGREDYYVVFSSRVMYHEFYFSLKNIDYDYVVTRISHFAASLNDLRCAVMAEVECEQDSLFDNEAVKKYMENYTFLESIGEASQPRPVDELIMAHNSNYVSNVKY